MLKKSVPNISSLAALTMVACSFLTLASAARADDDKGRGNAKCTARTIQGNFGYAAEGALIGIPGLPSEAPFRSVGNTHFDGKGNLTWVEHTVINGIALDADRTPATGTYAINANCTGSAIVYTPNSRDPLNLFFVVVKDGKEIRSILNVGAVSTVFSRVD